MVDFTVAIPTYNGANRLPDVLERLQAQIQTEDLSWEIIVVDNNSTDSTAQVVKNYQATWATACPLRYCFEAEQGAAFARQQAVEKARGKFVGFLDDDNLPAPDWVAAAYAFSQAHPQVGAYGSQIHGDFEVNPPEYLRSIACFLAIIERGPQAHRYEPRLKILPPAAGLVIRKEAWVQAVPKRLFLNYKGREAGLASEDLEVNLYIQKAGWEIWYNPQMQVTHKIPAWRFEKDYLVSLIRCIGLSQHHIRMLGLKPWQRPLATPIYLLNDLRKLVQHLLKYGGATGSNVVAACERERLLSGLVSPFFLWKKRYQDRVNHKSDRYWAAQIKNAFKTERFRFCYQPIVPLTNEEKKKKYCEFFLRLQDKTGHLILPEQFLPAARQHNLMGKIDRWVISTLFQEICQDVQSLYAINLSGTTLKDDGFIDFLRQQSQQHQVSPQTICFEITEAELIADLPQISERISELKQLGYRIAIDDFGFYVSSQEQLEKLPVDYLKIDGNIIKDSVGDPIEFERIKFISQIAEQLGIKTVAEFTENQAILEQIKTAKLNYAQGYGIAKTFPFPLRMNFSGSEEWTGEKWAV